MEEAVRGGLDDFTLFSDRIASHRAGRTVAACTPSDSVWRLCKVLDPRTNPGH